MTKVMKRSLRPTTALLLLLATGTAQAGLTMLSDSSYFSGGISIIHKSLGNGQLISGRLEYNVYDTQAYPEEFTGLDGANAPGSGRYLYAYQLFLYSDNDLGYTNVGTDYFAITGISQSILDNATIGYTVDDADNPGVSPTASSRGANKAIWDFSDDKIPAGARSVFLLFRSDGTPIWTTYEVIRQNDDDMVAPTIPEPAALLLLSAGAVFLRRRRR